MKGDTSRPLVATISYRALCRTMYGVSHRFWPVRGKPGLSVCLCCGCDQWLPRVKAWRVWTVKR